MEKPHQPELWKPIASEVFTRSNKWSTRVQSTTKPTTTKPPTTGYCWQYVGGWVYKDLGDGSNTIATGPNPIVTTIHSTCPEGWSPGSKDWHSSATVGKINRTIGNLYKPDESSRLGQTTIINSGKPERECKCCHTQEWEGTGRTASSKQALRQE